jgi:hypothetical protein
VVGPYAVRPSPGRRMECCTLAGQQQSAFPGMAEGSLRGAGGCPSSPKRRGKKRVTDPRGGNPPLGALSAPARMTKILEAEAGTKIAARLASPHHRTGGHHLG